MDNHKIKMTERDNALNQCGIGSDVNERFREGAKMIAKTTATFTEYAIGQLAHNLLVNKPCGIKTIQSSAWDATKTAFVSTMSAMANWDIHQARWMAAELLENVNDHEEAAKLFELAKGK